ncbi:MAG: FKBP-type peptidyl-prolyl cis-trans isomerase [Promethearchaeota archaeon]
MPKRNPKRDKSLSRYYKRQEIIAREKDAHNDRAPIYYGLLFVGIIVGLIALALVLTSNTNTGPRVKEGDVVTIKYIGTLNNGTIFDNGELTDIEVGNNNLLHYFDQELVGCIPGVKKSFTIPAKYGYTDPSHELYGQDLNFEITITKLVRDGKIIFPE